MNYINHLASDINELVLIFGFAPSNLETNAPIAQASFSDFSNEKFCI